jgi:hypothetical protein
MKNNLTRTTMPEIVISDNTKKAVAFLNALFPNKRINIVAIDPHSEHVTGITRPIDSGAIANFIEHNNGKRNVYYSVNTPTDDAPDNKLKKEHIKEINAVWLDADPAKDKDFNEERKRLHKFAAELAQSENPPTVITDSGGGVQAFWLLDKPIPATDENKKHYEALSRGLAAQYGTDKVQNIDRIMRVPYTWNIPSAKKKGREKTLARSAKINPRRYSDFKFITPSEAEEGINDIDYSKLDMTQVKVPPSKALLDKLAILRKRNDKIDDLWTNKIDMKPSRSERDFTLAKELKGEGCTLLEAAQIMYIYEHGKGKDLTAREIIRCYERSGNDFASGMDEATIERIASQTNPLLKHKQAVAALIEGAQFIWGADATRAGSGTPLFKHFMNRETVNVLFGPSGSGKSFLTLDMAMHLATGSDWAGFKCKQKMAVLYICTESGSSFGKRAEAARRRVGIKPGATPQEFPFAYYPAHVDLLANKDHLKLIAKLIDDLECMSGYKCGLIIVDTLSAAFGGGNENSEDMTKFVNNMASIKYGKKTAVMVVHHTGKDESAGARGHSSLKGNIDTEIQVRSEKRGEKYYRSFSSTKQKDDETGNNKRFGLQIVELGPDEDNDPITTCTVILEGDSEFEGMVPSIEDELDTNALAAYNAIKFYDALVANPDMKNDFVHTEREAKAIIFWDQIKQNGIFGCRGSGDKSLVPLNIMSKPNAAQLKAFGRACDILRTKGLVKETLKYQLVIDGEDIGDI